MYVAQKLFLQDGGAADANTGQVGCPGGAPPGLPGPMALSVEEARRSCGFLCILLAVIIFRSSSWRP